MIEEKKENIEEGLKKRSRRNLKGEKGKNNIKRTENGEEKVTRRPRKQRGETIKKSTKVKKETIEIKEKVENNSKEVQKEETVKNRRRVGRANKAKIIEEKSLVEQNLNKSLIEQKGIKALATVMQNKKPRLKIIPLGGLHEVGKNITVFEYGNDMIVVDCGLSFPEDDMLGIDLVIPDITYIINNKEKLRGIVITHGHEDHIGGVPYFLKQVNAPIYGTKLTLGLIRNKLEEHKLASSTELNTVNPGQTIHLGKFKIEFIASSHSIPDSVMLAITTPAGTVLHTGDFKIDYTPIDGKLMDFGRIAELGNQGILALMSDSTNAERKGFTMSESSVGEVFDKLFLH